MGQHPLLVSLCFAVADVHYEGETANRPLGSQDVGDHVFLRETSSEVPGRLFASQRHTPVCVPLWCAWQQDLVLGVPILLLVFNVSG